MRERRTASDTGDERRRLELHVRSLSPAGARSRQDAVISRLGGLAECDRIEGYAVHVWGTGVCLDSPAARTASGTFAVERLRTFEDWVAHNGLMLGRAFQTKEVHSTLTGKAYTERSFPLLTLAEWVGPELRYVTPCRDGAITHSVEDHLDALEDGRTSARETETVSIPAGRALIDAVDSGTDRVDEGANPFAIPGFVE